MTHVVKVQEAKTHLSALLVEVEAGGEVIVARGSRPVARIVPLSGAGRRTLGFLDLSVPDAAFAPLDEGELALWEA